MKSHNLSKHVSKCVFFFLKNPFREKKQAQKTHSFWRLPTFFKQPPFSFSLSRTRFGPASERFGAVAKEAKLTTRMTKAGTMSLGDRLRSGSQKEKGRLLEKLAKKKRLHPEKMYMFFHVFPVDVSLFSSRFFGQAMFEWAWS